MRNPGRFGISSPTHNNATRHVIEDDEVELTCKVAARDAVSSQGSDSKRNSTEERGIVVSTHVSVVSSGRKGSRHKLGSVSSVE